MNIVIEKLKIDDLKAAISIWDENHNTSTDYEKSAKIYSEIINNPAYHNIVAKINDQVIGLATVIINYDIVDQLKPFITVWNLSVHTNFRRMGVATKILKYIEDYATKNKCDFIAFQAEAKNVAAQKLYDKLGYARDIGYFKKIE